MNILVAGASGLIGTSLVKLLRANGHKVRILVRERSLVSAENIFWDPSTGNLDASQISDIDAVVNLSGQNIAGSKWTTTYKQKIRDSRIQTTQLLVDTICNLKNHPKVLLNASAVGFYGSRGSENIDESSSSGEGFLADVCREWEAVTTKASARGIRVVLSRTGMVLSPTGGALQKMLLPFKLGLGGKLGSGTQFMSWISLADAVNAMSFCLENNNVQGPVNLVAPQPLTNLEFTKTLGWVLRRPTMFTVPASVLKITLGQMADELLLSSIKAYPKLLLDNGYRFLHDRLDTALLAVMK